MYLIVPRLVEGGFGSDPKEGVSSSGIGSSGFSRTFSRIMNYLEAVVRDEEKPMGDHLLGTGFSK